MGLASGSNENSLQNIETTSDWDLPIKVDLDTARKQALEIGLNDVAENFSVAMRQSSRKSNTETLKRLLGTVQNDIENTSGTVLLKLTERDKSISWSEQSREIFIRYSRGVFLLVECLSLAIVTDRESILSQLFLPTDAP